MAEQTSIAGRRFGCRHAMHQPGDEAEAMQRRVDEDRHVTFIFGGSVGLVVGQCCGSGPAPTTRCCAFSVKRHHQILPT